MDYAIVILKCNLQSNKELTDVISKVDWGYVVTDKEGNQAGVLGETVFENPDKESFIDYGNITNAQLEEWITPKLDIEDLKETVNKRLEIIKNQNNRVDFRNNN